MLHTLRPVGFIVYSSSHMAFQILFLAFILDCLPLSEGRPWARPYMRPWQLGLQRVERLSLFLGGRWRPQWTLWWHLGELSGCTLRPCLLGATRVVQWAWLHQNWWPSRSQPCQFVRPSYIWSFLRGFHSARSICQLCGYLGSSSLTYLSFSEDFHLRDKIKLLYPSPQWHLPPRYHRNQITLLVDELGFIISYCSLVISEPVLDVVDLVLCSVWSRLHLWVTKDQLVWNLLSENSPCLQSVVYSLYFSSLQAISSSSCSLRSLGWQSLTWPLCILSFRHSSSSASNVSESSCIRSCSLKMTRALSGPNLRTTKKSSSDAIHLEKAGYPLLLHFSSWIGSVAWNQLSPMFRSWLVTYWPVCHG